jgi:hypothetical protein
LVISTLGCAKKSSMMIMAFCSRPIFTPACAK